MQSQTRKRYLACLLLVATFALSAASASSQERRPTASETNGCNCANASLIGDTVGTRFNLGPGPVNKVVGSGIELPGAGPVLGAAGPSPRWNIDFGTNTIRIDFLQQPATYGMGSYFTFSSLDPQLAGCPPAFVSGITVTTNKPTVPFNVVTAATFGPHTVTIKIAPASANIDWQPGEFILVKLEFACETQPPQPSPVDPCCPPWNKDILKNTMVYQGQGSIAGPYTLHFLPSSALTAQMNAYVTYVHSVNPAVNAITIDWSLIDLSNNSTVSIPASTTWNGSGSPTTTGDPNFFSSGGNPFPMQVGTWYRVHTVIRLLPNGQTFFSEKCRSVDLMVRIQVVTSKTSSSEPAFLEFSDDGKNVIQRVPIDPRRTEPNRRPN
jgi:hypothetical protein